MNSQYDHKTYEKDIYSLWETHEAFRPKAGHKPFTIIMPPPNANDPLHIGHAMFVAIEDILIRYHRMKGDDTLWLPGTDHAGIETQFVFEKKLKKNKQSRFDFDRETLYQKIWDYVQENSTTAIDQIKRLGASADWSRFKFMLDEDVVEVVLETFKKLQKENLLYRDNKLVNYCTHCGTSFSDLEVVYKDQSSPLYYVKYLFAKDKTKHLTVATVRPEPIWADTHLAVHPEDKKNAHLVGKTFLNPLTDAPMQIIADEFVDPEFGTGVVKLTPAHDFHDFEVAKKHNLPINKAVNNQGKIKAKGGDFAGMRVKKAREAVVKKLKEKGLIEKVDTTYANRVASCYRCKRNLEPLPLPQFFIKVKPLVKPILESLKKGEIKIHGAGYDKILKHWLENLRDWNISRQIVWGIRMPIWYLVDNNEEKLSIGFLDKDNNFSQDTLKSLLEKHSFKDIKKGLQTLSADQDIEYKLSKTEPKNGQWIQETDTFDTWFSSSQWPYSTLQALSKKQPAKNKTDYQRFYPTQVMETGYDILPFWVMRMLMMGKFATGKLPFTDVYLHGLVRDAKGDKMSKSKGNVVNPLETVEKYGADALRMALVIRSTPGLDKSVGEGDFKAMRNLTNKIWNAARFVMLNQEAAKKETTKLKTKDKEFKNKLDMLTNKITQQLEDLKLGLAAETVYNEFWHWFCDECIENNKKDLLSQNFLLEGLVTFLKLLHPFVPFVTEAVWQELRKKKLVLEEQKLLISSTWPKK